MISITINIAIPEELQDAAIKENISKSELSEWLLGTAEIMVEEVLYDIEATIEDVLEPYMIQQGFIMRTPRGRVVTGKTYQHFGLKAPRVIATENESLFVE